MNIIVNGCGKNGKTILASLVAEGHDVVAIDNKPQVINEITNIYDVMCVCGNGTDSDILLEAGATNAELMISMTGSDELNMLSCYLAKKLGAQYTIARIRNPEYNDKSLGFMREQLDLSLTLNPELLASVELYNILKLPSAAKVETFSARKFEMVEIKLKPDSPLGDLAIAVELLKRHHILVCRNLEYAVRRGVDDQLARSDMLLTQFIKDRRAGGGLVAQRAAACRLFKALDKVLREPLRECREGALKLHARNLPMAGGRILAGRYLAHLAVRSHRRRNSPCKACAINIGKPHFHQMGNVRMAGIDDMSKRISAGVAVCGSIAKRANTHAVQHDQNRFFAHVFPPFTCSLIP